MYYIINGAEITLCFLPVFMHNPYARFIYSTCMYFYFNSDIPFYYGELKNNFLKYKKY